MGKKSKARKKVYQTKGWKTDSKDGKFLTKLIKSGEITVGMPPAQIKEKWPQFKVYKADPFSSGLRRIRGKLGLLTRDGAGKSLVLSYLLYLLFLAASNTSIALSLLLLFLLKVKQEACTLGTKDTTDDDDDDYDDDDDETPRDIYADDDDVEVVDPPVAVVGVKPAPTTPFASTTVSTSVARMPSSVQSVAQRPYTSYCWSPPYLKTSFFDYEGLEHQFCAIHLPSGVAFKYADDIGLSMKQYKQCDGIQWPDTFDMDDGEKFLSFLKRKKLGRMRKKWQDLNNQAEIARAKQQFEATWVLLRMAVKQEMIRMRNSKGSTVLRSQTCIKMDFPVERLTHECWDMIGDPTNGVRMLVVDLEQATENEDYKESSIERRVDLIGYPLLEDTWGVPDGKPKATDTDSN